MAESPSPASTPAPAAEVEAAQYWCHHCSKRVSVETLANRPDVICRDCKNGFVEAIPASATPVSLSSDHADDTFGSPFLQMLRIIAQAARDEDAPPSQLRDDYQLEDDFLRIDFGRWDNDEDEEEEEEEEEDDDDDDEDEEEEDANGNENVNENENENEADENRAEGGEREGEEEEEGEEDRSDNENDENREEDDDEDLRRRRRDILSVRIRDFATRARSGRNRILDWAEILMGLEDSSIEFRLEVPELDRFVGNPQDYVDAAGYEQLLQSLAESDGGRRGAPPAAKSAVSSLAKVEVTKEEEAEVCAICKDMVSVGEIETKLPCGHGYHGECIVPWLGSRNSCPVCRFELPTDDADYEEERKKRVAATVGGASGSGGNNSGSN